MTKSFYYLSLLFAIINPIYFYSQLPCGSDEMALDMLNQHPELLTPWKKQWYFQENLIQNFQPVSRGGNPYLIPVVVHVIHNDGNENISDEQIKKWDSNSFT